VSLFAELKRRSVFKVGAAYVVVGWIVIEVAATLAPQLNLPDWAPRLITLIVLLGFPIALVLAWALDMTPDGIKVTSGAGNKRFYGAIAVLTLAAIGWYWYGTHRAVSSDLSSARSIAVLPFVNMSGDKDNEYFSDGISEEILNVLAEMSGLEVAARTSSFAFRGSKEEVPQIAKQLNVRMVLEGSVRKQHDRVRITAQLIDSSTGYHVWSQTYDRELKDIFAVQDEIARAIADELELRVSGDKAVRGSHRGTQNRQAYDLYLRGMALWQGRHEDDLWKAIAAFEQAIAADPKFAEAYGGLSLAYVIIPDYSARISYADAYAKATDAAEMALALDLHLPEPYGALATVAGFEGRRKTGIALYEQAIALRPSFATAYQWMGTDLLMAGDPVAGLAAAQRAATLDPQSKIVLDNLGVLMLSLGRNAEARAACERAFKIDRDYVDCMLLQALADLSDNDVASARTHFVRAATLREPQTLPLVNAIFDALAGHGDSKGAAAQLATYSEKSSRGETTFGTIYAPALLLRLGAPDLALDYLEKTVAHPESGNAPPEWPMFMPLLDPIRCTPRFEALVRQRNTTDPRAASVCASATRQ